MNNYEKINIIEETLDKLYKVLPTNLSIEGTKNCAISIMILEKIKEKLEKKNKN